jgi:transposase
MRFVPIKSCEQQGVMSLHRVREGWKEERTTSINRIRGVLAEFGLVFGKSPKVLRAVLAEVIEDAENELSTTALTASVGDFKQFKAAHQFGAWLGLVPRQNSSGGKTSLGRITKRGDDYLRTLLIQGAKSAVMSAPKRDDPTSRWLVQLSARVGWQKACVAMANKNARILWAVMTREAGFDPKHVSIKPLAKIKPPPAMPRSAVPCPA